MNYRPGPEKRSCAETAMYFVQLVDAWWHPRLKDFNVTRNHKSLISEKALVDKLYHDNKEVWQGKEKI